MAHTHVRTFPRNLHGEEHKEFLVVLADAVVDPGAVVVHVLHAVPARRTVVGKVGLVVLALRATRPTRAACTVSKRAHVRDGF